MLPESMTRQIEVVVAKNRELYMEQMEFMEQTIIKFPWMRMQLKDTLYCLSDKDHQYNRWVLHKNDDGIQDEFDYSVHFLYDDTPISEDTYGCIKIILIDKEEATAVKRVILALEFIFDKYGLDLRDEEYINLPEWIDVINAAKNARKIVADNDEKYEIQKLYDKL